MYFEALLNLAIKGKRGNAKRTYLGILVRVPDKVGKRTANVTKCKSKDKYQQKVFFHDNSNKEENWYMKSNKHNIKAQINRKVLFNTK